MKHVHHRWRAVVRVALATIALSIALAACSISTEDTPRPINRETTDAPTTSTAP